MPIHGVGLRNLRGDMSQIRGIISGGDGTLRAGTRFLGDLFTSHKMVDTQINRNTATDIRSKTSVYKADKQLLKAMGEDEDAVNDYMQKHQGVAQDEDLDLSKKDVRRLKRIKSDIADAEEKKGAPLTQQEQDAIVKDNNFDPARYNKLKALNESINESKELAANSVGATKDFISAMTDAVNAAPGSAERGLALSNAMDALESMRDDYGIIHLSPEALNVLPKQRVTMTSNRRGQTVQPQQNDPLEVSDPVQLIQTVSGVLASRYNGTSVGKSEIQNMINASRQSTSLIDKDDENKDVSLNNTKDKVEEKKDNTLVEEKKDNTKTTDVTKDNTKDKVEVPTFNLVAAEGDKNPIKGEPGVKFIPKIAQNQVGPLQDQLIALSKYYKEHPDGKSHAALDALAARLGDDKTKGQRGHFGKLTIAALAEATGQSPEDLAKVDLTQVDANKDLLAKLQLPKQKEETLTKTNTTANTQQTVVKADGIADLLPEDTKLIQGNLVKLGLLTEDQATGKWDAAQKDALTKMLTQFGGEPKIDAAAFIKDPHGTVADGRTIVQAVKTISNDQVYASTQHVLEKNDDEPSVTNSKRIIGASDLQHKFLQELVKTNEAQSVFKPSAKVELPENATDKQIIEAFEKKAIADGQKGITADGQMQVNELTQIALSVDKTRGGLFAPGDLIKALDKLLEDEGIKKISGVYADTKALDNMGDLGMANGGNKTKDKTITK